MLCDLLTPELAQVTNVNIEVFGFRRKSNLSKVTAILTGSLATALPVHAALPRWPNSFAQGRAQTLSS